MGIVFLTVWLVSAAWLWFAMVYVTKNHYYNWKELVFWVAMIAVITWVAIEPLLDVENRILRFMRIPAAYLVRGILVYLVLTFRYQIAGIATKMKILGIYLGIGLALQLLIRVLIAGTGDFSDDWISDT